MTTSYGSFGTASLDVDLGLRRPKWGNFISASGLNTDRFLDPPEFQVLHDKGNEENFFDRFDFKLSDADTIQLNLNSRAPGSKLPIPGTSNFKPVRFFPRTAVGRYATGSVSSTRSLAVLWDHRSALANHDL